VRTRSRHLTTTDYVIIYATTFASGFLNASVGGGGLLQIPTLLLVLPNTPLPALLGTAKLAGVPGLGGALYTYRRRVRELWPLIVRASAAEIPTSVLGARVATVLSPSLARPIVLVMLTLMSLHVLLRRRFGEETEGRVPRLTGAAPWIIGAVIGFYEGFFGAGSGTVLIVLFGAFCGLDLAGASIASAAVTFAGAGAALVYFTAVGSVLLPLGLSMIVFNVVGAQVGARFITLRGNTVIRRALGVVLLALIARLLFD
jgi:uncharacterized membrane protein YfcA